MPNLLAALFLPKRRLAAADPLILQRGGLLGGSQWVVPRAECQYRRHDFSAIPARQRHAAAALHVKRLLPTVDALARIGWLGSTAHFWIWEKPLPAVVRSRQKWLPESALRRPLLPTGLHLIQCQAGVEGQAWRDGNLMASHWWPEAPTTEEWYRFLRGAAVPVDQSPVMPAIQRAPLLDYPWPQMQPVRGGRLANSEFIIWLTSFCLLAAAAGWQISSLHEWNKLREKQQHELSELRLRSGPILDARERAELAVARLEELQKLQAGINDYDLIAEVVRPLPARTRLQNYLRESGKLTVRVELPNQGAEVPVAAAVGTMTGVPNPQPPNIDVRRIVALYQGHPLLAEVTATPVIGGLELVFTLPQPESEDEMDVDSEGVTGRVQ